MGEIMRPRKRQKRTPVCKHCEFTSEDVGKFLPAPFRGRLHVMLEKNTDDVYSCPKCNISVVSKQFKKKEQPWVAEKRLTRESQHRVEKLRRIYSKSHPFSEG
jgi:hypothetical protein